MNKTKLNEITMNNLKTHQLVIKLAISRAKNSEILQELSARIKAKRIRFTQRHQQCIGGLLSWDQADKYWLDLTELDENLTHYAKTHWHALETEPAEEKVIFNCQECQTPIKMSQPDKKGRTVLEFYGKWSSQGSVLVCQSCLEKKE